MSTAASEDLTALRHHGDREVRPGDADHAVNVLAGGPPPWLADALAAVDLTRYPDDGDAVAAIAAMHGRDLDEVVITNGASEALWLLGPALTPRRAALIQPGFTETEAALRAHGVPVERCFEVDDVPAEADLVVVTNPTSPHGALRDAGELMNLRADGRTIVIDEAFMSMVPGEPSSLANRPLPDIVIVRSLTKLLSVPGLRVGYALAPARLAARLHGVKPPWSANAMALAALVAAAEHRHELTARALQAGADRDDLASRLERIDGLHVHRSQTNYLLITVPDGPALVAALRAQRIAVRPAASFPGCGANDIRLTARDPEANARLAAAIETAL